MVNNTQAYLVARAPISTMAFSGAVTTISVGLNGPGGQNGAGYPLTRRGYITGLYVWDGTTLRYDMTEIVFQAGDRISIYCQNSGSDFAVKLRVNGASSSLQVTGVPFNATLYVTVEFMLVRE